MSTHTYPTTSTETDRPTAPRPTSDPTETDESREYHETATGGDTDDTDSWVARCQRQFDAGATSRLRNCVDDENGAMPTPHDP